MHSIEAVVEELRGVAFDGNGAVDTTDQAASMATPRITYAWDGKVMTPYQRHMPLCNQIFVAGSSYELTQVPKRSRVTHNHFFKCLSEAWKNLPEYLQPEFPQDDDKWRKWLLIEAGYCTETRFNMGTPEKAMELAALVAGFDEYARVDIRGEWASIRKAISQKVEKMPPAQFQKCKEDVFGVIFKLTGIDPTTLERNAGRAA